MLISHFASAWETTELGGLPSPNTLTVPKHPGSAPHHVNPLHCKILGTPMGHHPEYLKLWKPFGSRDSAPNPYALIKDHNPR